MKKIIIILCFLTSYLNVLGQADLIESQQQLIGQLSGKFPLEDGSYLSSRDTPKNREAARQYLSDQIKTIGLEPKEQPYRMPNLNPLIDMLFAPFTGANVYTVIPATNGSSEYVILGAHFDSELSCPGAIDNATGSVLVFSVGKLLSALPERSMNVVVAFFDQEEEDLVGSQALRNF